MGVNTLVSRSDGQTIASSDVNQYRTAMNEDIVPRNASGVPTDLGGDIGNATYGWDNAYAETFKVGDPASGLNIKRNGSGQMSFESSDVERVVIDNDGLDGDGIKDLSVTREKQEAVGQQLSATSGNFTTSSTSFVDVTNLSVTITTSGRPVVLILVSDGVSSSNLAAVGISGTTAANDVAASIAFVRDATLVSFQVFQARATGSGQNFWTPASGFSHTDVVGAGTYTYKVQVQRNAFNGNATVNYCKLLAYEL